MTGRDAADASQALLDWLCSQDITPDNAVRVLTITLVATIHEIAVTEGRSAKRGGEIIAGIIRDSLP